jgi:hypothetical protein
MIPLHALALMIMGRFNARLYVGYCSWYAIGTLASMQVPFVGFQPVRKASEHMGALGKIHIASINISGSLRHRCLWLAPDCCIRATCQIPCLVQTVPGYLVLFCHLCRPRRCSCYRWFDIQGLDCSLDWTILLSVGYRLRQKVIFLSQLLPVSER